MFIHLVGAYVRQFKKDERKILSSFCKKRYSLVSSRTICFYIIRLLSLLIVDRLFQRVVQHVLSSPIRYRTMRELLLYDLA